jgi:LPXTG-site transpeptidase (sortase) family protein
VFTKAKNRLKSLLFRKKKGRPRKNKLHTVHKLGTILVIIGLVFVLYTLLYKRLPRVSLPKNFIRQEVKILNDLPQTQNQEPIKIDPNLLSTKEQLQPPERIIIPGQKINLPIIEAKVVNGYWELSETTASHGIGSANPGEIGNIVIFAHAREGLFLSLKNVKENDEVFVLTKDRWYRYQVKEIKDINPDQTEVIAPTKDETLTLYTCSGFMDSTRRIVIAKREF